jgi:peroxiredoxin
MTLPTPLVPRRPVPELDVPLVGGGRFVRGEAPGSAFDLLVFYRGLHCPVCAKYLLELERLEPEYASRGVGVLALSSDGEERAARMAEKVRAKGVRFGYGLSLAEARRWGLYLSRGKGVSSIGIEEPARFNEPGVFLVRPDGTLYYGAVQTMPFARPHFDELLTAVDFSLKKDYPARGEDVDPA